MLKHSAELAYSVSILHYNAHI